MLHNIIKVFHDGIFVFQNNSLIYYNQQSIKIFEADKPIRKPHDEENAADEYPIRVKSKHVINDDDQQGEEEGNSLSLESWQMQEPDNKRFKERLTERMKMSFFEQN